MPNISQEDISLDDKNGVSREQSVEFLKPLIYKKYLSYPKHCKYRLIRTYSSLFSGILLLKLLAFDILIVATQTINFLGQQKLIDMIIGFKELKESRNYELRSAIAYLMIIIVSKLLNALLVSQNYMLAIQLYSKIFASLIGIIYEKIIQISNKSQTEISTGEIDNLVQTYSQNISDFFLYLYFLFYFVINFGISFYIFYFYLGNIGFLTISFMIIYCIIYSLLIKKSEGVIQKNQVAQDERLKYTTQVLSNMKVITMNGWANKFEENIAKFRKTELKSLYILLLLNGLIISSNFLFPQFCNIITFLFYELSKTQISMGTIFTILNLISSLADPLNKIPDLVIKFIHSLVNSNKIENIFDSLNNEESSVLHQYDNSSKYSITIKSNFIGWKKSKDLLNFQNQESAPSKSPESLKIPTKTKTQINKNVNGKNSKRLKSFTKKVFKSMSTNCKDTAKDQDNSFNMNIILKDVDIKIKKGELVFIIGSVGSGKSSLFHALNNELITLSQEADTPIKINGKIAYVDQIPWIQSTNIEENITFLSTYNENKLDQVVKLCQLEKDLKSFSLGIKAEIGEKGANLSGGQKMRISLARALYSEADIYLLDDPLSCLDIDMKSIIINDCICSYLKGKTILYSTDSKEYLKSADKILLINNHKIEFFGTYNEYINSFADCSKELDKALLSKDSKENGNGLVKSYQTLSKSLRERKISDTSKLEIDHLRTEEENTVTKVDLKIFLEYFNKLGGISFLVICFALLSIWCGLNSYCNLFLGKRSDYNYKEEYNSFQFIEHFLLISFISMFSLVSCILIIILNSIRSSLSFHNSMLHHILNAPLYQFHDKNPTGRIINRLTKDLLNVDIELPFHYLRFLIALTSFLSTIFLCIISIYWTLIIFPICIFINYYYFKIYLKMSRVFTGLQRKCMSKIFQMIHETNIGKTTIGLFENRTDFYSKFNSLVDTYSQNTIYLAAAFCFYNIKIYFWNTGFFAVIMILALINTQYFAASLIVAAISNSFSIENSLYLLFVYLETFEIEIISFERCSEYTKIQKEQNIIEGTEGIEGDPSKTSFVNFDFQSKTTQTKSLGNNQELKLKKLKGSIKFEDYSTKYDDEVASPFPFPSILNLNLILKNINLEIMEGEKIGIVGRSGAGKSTLFLAILKILNPVNGKLYIGGQNIMDLDISTLRNQITIIPQDPSMFLGTLRENIDPLEVHSKEDILSAIESIGLKKFVNFSNFQNFQNFQNYSNFQNFQNYSNFSNFSNFPKFSNTDESILDFKIKEFGENLSVGERQLICLARAFLKKSKIILMDEATSSLDSTNESIINDLVFKFFKNCTVISIAHNIKAISNYDRIIVMDSGRIIKTIKIVKIDKNDKIDQIDKNAKNAKNASPEVALEEELNGLN